MQTVESPRKVVRCLICGQEFEANGFPHLGKLLWPTIHVECTEAANGCAGRKAKLGVTPVFTEPTPAAWWDES